MWCENGKIALTTLIVLRDLLYTEDTSNYRLCLRLKTYIKWHCKETMHVADSSVKMKIAQQKYALKIKTFKFPACCHFKHREYLYYSNSRRQGKKGEEITLQVCNSSNKDAYRGANSCGTFKVKCC